MSTLKDVAVLANVSPITVSRVINTPDLVKPGTRLKVQKAMDQLQYSPNIPAKNLVTKRSGIINVYIPENMDLSNPFSMHFIAGVSQGLGENMYSFLLLRDRKIETACDGYIVTGLEHREIYEFDDFARKRNRPIVLFGHTDIEAIDCIDIDNVAGAFMATEYLIRNGHRKIAMINVNENRDYVTDRLNGYRKALDAYDIPYRKKRVIYAENNIHGGIKAVEQLLESDRPTAIFCATDTMAIGVSRALSDAGLKIPEDISLIGYDGLGHQLLITPHLTTIRQPVIQAGRLMAETLLQRLQGNSADRIVRMICPELLEGDSVAEI